MIHTVDYIIEDILVTCFESGYSDWFIVDNSTSEWSIQPEEEAMSTWAAKLLNQGKAIYLINAANEQNRWTLTKEKLMSGYEQNFKERPHDADIDKGDAFTRDAILQYALFGAIRYE